MIAALQRYFRRRQFNPGLIGVWLTPFYLARRGLWKAIERNRHVISGDVLDVGCGVKPYRDLFFVKSYVGLEYDSPMARERAIADAYYDGGDFPFDGAVFDSVLCNQVLEHVFNPEDFLKEINRVLKPGGRLLLTVPFIWDEHEQPHDFARYTSFGLRALMERNGFEMERQIKILADGSLLFQLINTYLFKILPVRSVLAKLVLRIFVFSPFNLLGLVAEFLLPRNPDLFLDQLVVVRKSVVTSGRQSS